MAPLDIETIRRSVAKTGRLLIVDEAFGPCGIGAEIAAQVGDRGFDDLDAPIRRLNGRLRRHPTARRWKPRLSPTRFHCAGNSRPRGRVRKRPPWRPRSRFRALGWNMEEGHFVGWLKRDGEQIVPGEPLFSLEGDKATQDVESLEAGILRIAPTPPRKASAWQSGP